MQKAKIAKKNSVAKIFEMHRNKLYQWRIYCNYKLI